MSMSPHMMVCIYIYIYSYTVVVYKHLFFIPIQFLLVTDQDLRITIRFLLHDQGISEGNVLEKLINKGGLTEKELQGRNVEEHVFYPKASTEKGAETPKIQLQPAGIQKKKT